METHLGDYATGHHMWIRTYLRGLITAVTSHLIVFLLFVASLASLILVLGCYLYHILAWVLSLALLMIKFLAIVLHYLVSWTVFGMSLLSSNIFFYTFPACIVAIPLPSLHRGHSPCSSVWSQCQGL